MIVCGSGWYNIMIFEIQCHEILNINKQQDNKILANSIYFDSISQMSYMLLVTEVRHIGKLPLEVQDSLLSFTKIHECLDQEKIMIIIKVEPTYCTLMYASLINDDTTKTYNYQFHQESFFFNDKNMIVGMDGIGITKALPIPTGLYKITSRFGIRKDPVAKRRHRRSYHSGLDFAAKPGTAIYAMADGIVSLAMYKNDYGNHIIIKHDNNLETLYAHMIRLPLLKKGDFVKKGQIIGYVGSTGYSTGPHLHLEVRQNNIRCNPELFFSFAKKLLTKTHQMRQNFIKLHINKIIKQLLLSMNSSNRQLLLKYKHEKRPLNIKPNNRKINSKLQQKSQPIKSNTPQIKSNISINKPKINAKTIKIKKK